jgi:acyl-CoA dehydrogenase
MGTIRFEPCTLPPAAEALRAEVREFLKATLGDYPAIKRARSWTISDAEFSREVGARGWIGMTWPKAYGGHERSALERYVVLEEMLSAGAPVGGHWVADRQSGPLLLRFGTEDQRKRILPPITRGESCFCIGMSEPDSGSDLASIRTKAEKTDGGWIVNGTKLWTSKAHYAHYMIALIRTATDPDDRHAGLSQFLIDMGSAGVTVRPIRNLIGEEQFNEVVFEDAFVPDDMAIGAEGAGWSQVTAELALERSGPERYLSSYQLLVELIGEIAKEPTERTTIGVGRLVARLATIRQMSVSVAGMLEAGASPALEGALVKELGGVFEQDIPRIAHDLTGAAPLAEGGGDYDQVLAYLTQASVAFSLRGGTREILRVIIARGLELR